MNPIWWTLQRNANGAFKSLFLLGAALVLGATTACTREEKPREAEIACPDLEFAPETDGRRPCQRPTRIVTLMPSLAEMLFDIDGNGDRIVGVSEFTDFPRPLAGKPSVGPYQNVNLEKIRSLKPDFVIASRDGNSRDQIARLREWGYPVLVVDTTSLEKIRGALRSITLISRANRPGWNLWDKFATAETDIELRSRKIDRFHRKKVLLQIGDEPLVVVGGKSYLNEVTRLIGAKNIYADSALGYPRVAYEDVVQKNPDVIVILALHGDSLAFSRMRERWSRFKSLRAVRNRSVIVLKSDALLRPGMRVIEGMRVLQETIYPVLKRSPL